VFDELEQVILREMERGSLPGLAVALVKGDDIVWSKGYGLADLEAGLPVTPGTVFPACSVTKPVVATAIMQWHERGAFGLGDPVNAHMGAVKLQNEWEQQSPVTIRHLLTHSSGLPVDQGYPLPSSFSSLEEYVGAVARTVRPAGEEVVYANRGYAVLGHLVGRFAGCPYEEYMQENIFAPLGMRSSALERAPEGAGLAAGYYVSGADGKRYRAEFPPPRFPGPAGSLFTTAEDLARFLIAHLNGGVCDGRRILTEGTADDMKRVHARTGPAWTGMGLGFMVDEIRGRRLFWHAGNMTGWTTFICGSPEKKAGVVLLINMGSAETARSAIVHSALRAVAGDGHDLPPATSQSGWRLPLAECEQLTGLYTSNLFARADLGAEDGLLTLRTDAFLVDPVEAVSYLEPIAAGRFRVHDGGFGGWELTFGFDADGNATSFVGGVYPWLFRRSGSVPSAVTVEEDADLAGRWAGVVSTPMGPVPAILEIVGAERAKVTALTAQRAELQDFGVRSGRASGYFEVALGDLGEWTVFLRLAAIGGKLQGRAYARGELGEMPMDVELNRE
jgi:CubicO group peptidase (beta-lactamase class C family)